MTTRTPLSSRTANARANPSPHPDHIKEQLKAGKHFPSDCPHAPRAQAAPKTQGTKRKSSSSADKNNDENRAPKRSKSSKPSYAAASKSQEGLTDIASVRLPGEETGSVPIFATCGDIRQQLGTVLSKPDVTQASFRNAISAVSGTHVTPRQLGAFRSKHGKSGGGATVHGADSPVFYAAWVYFEKERVLRGGKKTKRREEMEKAWGEEGMNRHGLKPVTVTAGSSIWYDKYGRLLIDGRLRSGNPAVKG